MPTRLQSGKYSPDTDVDVYHWPKPDVNGDGDLVYQDMTDDQGNVYARDEVTDDQGNAVHRYLPPPGFTNKPNYEATENWVLTDERGRIKRDPDGRAYAIREGQALVVHPDGTSVIIEGDYAKSLFMTRHTRVDDPVSAKPAESAHSQD